MLYDVTAYTMERFTNDFNIHAPVCMNVFLNEYILISHTIHTYEHSIPFFIIKQLPFSFIFIHSLFTVGIFIIIIFYINNNTKVNCFLTNINNFIIKTCILITIITEQNHLGIYSYNNNYVWCES